MKNLQLSTQIVEPNWLARPSTEVAPELIGCTVVRQIGEGNILRGMIVETEAYGPEDPACHGYRRRTKRNGAMFSPAGRTYVYLIYGVYFCLNVVTDEEDIPSAVLIRALQLESVPSWVKQGKPFKPHRIAAGPGKLCKVLQIDARLNNRLLNPKEPLWLEHRSPQFQPELVQTTRIGLSKGTDLPWRWYLKDSPSVSRRG